MPVLTPISLPVPEGVELFDGEDSPSKVKLAGLCTYHDPDDKNNHEGCESITACFEPGEILVTFEDGVNGFDRKDEAKFKQILNEVGNLAARLVNIEQGITTIRDINEIIFTYREMLNGKLTSVPQVEKKNERFENKGLETDIDIAEGFLKAFQNTVDKRKMPENLEKEKERILQELKQRGVKNVCIEEMIQGVGRTDNNGDRQWEI